MTDDDVGAAGRRRSPTPARACRPPRTRARPRRASGAPPRTALDRRESGPSRPLLERAPASADPRGPDVRRPAIRRRCRWRWPPAHRAAGAPSGPRRLAVRLMVRARRQRGGRHALAPPHRGHAQQVGVEGDPAAVAGRKDQRPGGEIRGRKVAPAARASRTDEKNGAPSSSQGPQSGRGAQARRAGHARRRRSPARSG